MISMGATVWGFTKTTCSIQLLDGQPRHNRKTARKHHDKQNGSSPWGPGCTIFTRWSSMPFLSQRDRMQCILVYTVLCPPTSITPSMNPKLYYPVQRTANFEVSRNIEQPRVCTRSYCSNACKLKAQHDPDSLEFSGLHIKLYRWDGALHWQIPKEL
jgi:hypothetical protein